MLTTRRNAKGEELITLHKSGENVIERFRVLCRAVECDYPPAAEQARAARDAAEQLLGVVGGLNNEPEQNRSVKA